MFERLYHHDRVMRVMNSAEGVVHDLVEAYASGRGAMPAEWVNHAENFGERQRLRLVGDFVAGMTDRYAIEQHRRMFDHTPELR